MDLTYLVTGRQSYQHSDLSDEMIGKGAVEKPFTLQPTRNFLQQSIVQQFCFCRRRHPLNDLIQLRLFSITTADLIQSDLASDSLAFLMIKEVTTSGRAKPLT